MQIVAGTDSKKEVVVLTVVAKDGMDGEAKGKSVTLSRFGQSWKIPVGAGAKMTVDDANFFIMQSKNWDITNPLALQMKELSVGVGAGAENEADSTDAELDSLINQYVEKGLGGKRQAKKMSKDELKAALEG